MKVLVLFTLIVLMGHTTAQSSLPKTLLPEDKAVRLVEAAREEVLLATPGIYSRQLAEALREAMVVRGVAVYLLVPANSAEDRASYVASLSLAGARVRFAEIEGSVLVVDRQQVVTSNPNETSDAARAVAWFYDAFRTAPIYDLTRSNFLEGETP